MEFYFENLGGANIPLIISIVMFFIPFATLHSQQCATLTEQGFQGSLECGCYTTNIVIDDLPGNIIYKLSFKVTLTGSPEVFWAEEEIMSSINPAFISQGSTLDVDIIDNQLYFDYQAVTNNASLTNGETVLQLKYCAPPYESLLVSISANDDPHFEYISGGFPIGCDLFFGASNFRPFPGETISGRVHKPSPGSTPCINTTNLGINNVIFSLDDVCTEGFDMPLSDEDISNSSGNYLVEGINSGEYILSADKESDPFCGITWTDYWMVFYQIVHTNQFIYPWQYIAADMNQDRQITNRDLLHISYYLQTGDMHEDMQFEAWRFIPEVEYNANMLLWPLNLRHYPVLDNHIEYIPLLDDHLNTNWIGVKLGDVTGQCTDCDGVNWLVDPELNTRQLTEKTHLTFGSLEIGDANEILLPIYIERYVQAEVLLLDLILPEGFPVSGIETNCSIMEGMEGLYNQSGRQLNFNLTLGETCYNDIDQPICFIVLDGDMDYMQPLIDDIRLNEGSVMNTLLEDYWNISSLAIEDKKSFDASIFPNPVSERLYIEFRDMDNLTNRKCDIWITNMTGQTVFHRTFSNHDQQLAIEVENLPSGLYIINILNGEISQNYKFIVKR